MATVTLGLSGAIGYDPAAAIFVDGQLVAAAEEERLVRRKHAKGMMPYHAARFCLQYAGVRPKDVNVVAIPYAPVSLFSKARWHYAWRHWYAPDRALDALFNGNRRYRRYLRELKDLLEKLHVSWSDVRIVPVQHQLAHASSAYHLSGFKEKTAILSIDRKGEYATIFLGYGENGRIIKRKQFYDPDSLAGMYAAITDYLGFEILDGEYKVMGMAPFGDPHKYDLSPLAEYDGRHFSLNTRLIGTVGMRRYKAKSRGHYFSQKLVDMLGPRREGNLVDDPYIHYAAAIQKLYEDIAVSLVIAYLSDVLQETGKLVFAGTSSFNIKLNQRLLSLPQVKELFVHPACGDAGTAIGAASWALHKQGIPPQPLKHVSLGPKFSTAQCASACRNHRERPVWEELDNAPHKAAELLAKGELVGWFQGRMEFGPRALGNRSILANPAQEGIIDLLNRQVKFRERWRPFCPSILEEYAKEFIQTDHPAKFMSISFPVAEAWREKYPSVIYKDGTSRVQVVSHNLNPRVYQVLKYFHEMTGHPLVINTTLNRPGEALVASPEDALDMFLGSDLSYLIMEDLLVTKRAEPEDW